MGNSSVTATNKKSVYMTHVCSKCQCPIISVIQIEAITTLHYFVLGENAENDAYNNSENIIERETCKIDSLHINKVRLQTLKNEEVKIKNGYYSFSIKGFDTPCPNCFHMEPWQKTIGDDSKIIGLSDENFPLTYTSKTNVENWANKCITSLIERIEGLRNNNELVEQKKNSVLASTKRIEEIERMINNIPEIKNKESLSVQLDELKQHKKLLGVFDFKRKKEIDIKIKLVQDRIIEINKIIADKKKPLEAEKNKLGENIQYDQAIAYGCSGNVNIKKLMDSLCYCFTANDILLSDYDNFASSNNTQNEVVNVKDDEKAIFCHKCGFKLLEQSSFCSRCGASI